MGYLHMNIKKVILFLSITFIISWVIMLFLYLMGFKLYTSASGFYVLFIMLVPELSAIIIQKIIFKDRLKSIGFTLKFDKYIVLAWLLPVVLLALTVILSSAVFNTNLIFDYSNLFTIFSDLTTAENLATIKTELPKLSPLLFMLMVLIGNVAQSTIFTFGEEAGWRGLLYNEFRHFGLVKSSILIGTIWGIWHFPLMLMGHIYPDNRILGVFLMIIWCILLTPILMLLRYKTKSILASAIFHSSINAMALLGILFITNGNELTMGLTGIPGMVILFIVNCIVFFLIKKNKNIMTLHEQENSVA